VENGDDQITLGLLLTVPIATGGASVAQVRKARATLEAIQTRVSQTENSIRIELANARLRMGEALERIEAAGRAVDTARRTYEIAETRVTAGLATQVELQGVSVALSRAQVAFYSAIFDYLVAYFDWEAATGEVSREVIEE
jgi:outer membrane protein TolC